MTEEKEYENDILFARLSKAGNHVYMFNREGKAGMSILGEGVESLLINVEDLQALLGGAKWAKVSVMREEKNQEGDSL